jgi:hypothetical protein
MMRAAATELNLFEVAIRRSLFAIRDSVLARRISSECERHWFWRTAKSE